LSEDVEAAYHTIHSMKMDNGGKRLWTLEYDPPMHETM
jgi:hypothetical protein